VFRVRNGPSAARSRFRGFWPVKSGGDSGASFGLSAGWLTQRSDCESEGELCPERYDSPPSVGLMIVSQAPRNTNQFPKAANGLLHPTKPQSNLQDLSIRNTVASVGCCTCIRAAAYYAQKSALGRQRGAFVALHGGEDQHADCFVAGGSATSDCISPSPGDENEIDSQGVAEDQYEARSPTGCTAAHSQP